MRRTTKPVLNNPFLARAIDEDLNSALKAFENGLAVSLIATPRDKIRTCHVDEDLATVVAANRADRFDFLPVIAPQGDPSDRIIGLIDLESFMSANATLEGAVRDHMRALSEENLIGADAGILAFVRDADQHRLRLIVSDREISGLVSLSDLQKLPARAALFAIVTQLEMVMADAIRQKFQGSEGWLDRLPVATARKAAGRNRKVARRRYLCRRSVVYSVCGQDHHSRWEPSILGEQP
jgi:hypothetical protein